MHGPEVEDHGWPALAATTSVSGRASPVAGHNHRRSALWWGLSCAVHLALLVGMGLWSYNLGETPQTTPIRVAFMPALAPGTEPETTGESATLPEEDLPMPHAPEPLDIVPEITPPRELPAALEPSPLAQTEPIPTRHPVDTPAMPSPPVVARPPTPRLPHTLPARELPRRGRPTTIFDDAIVARAPSNGPHPHTTQPTTPADSTAPEPTAPQASLPRSSGVRYGQNPTPAYPAEARRRGWEGTVLLMVEIQENGRPERVTIKQSSGYSVLDEAALGAVRRWTFIPAQRDDKPVRSLAEVPIVFSLRAQR